jgi:ATP-binding cassette subfamily F protein 3
MLALNDFPGAVIVISHDRHLVEASADRLWLVKDGNVSPYDGDIEEYRTEVLTGKRPARKEVAIEPEPRNSAEKRRLAAERRKALAPLQKKIKDAETAMARLQKVIGEIDSRLASPDLYSNDPAKSQQMAKDRAEAEKQLRKFEESWLALSERYEAEMADA